VKEAGTPGGTLKGIDKVEYGRAWGTVSNAPFSGYKTEMLEGGTSSPTIVVLPGQTTAQPPLTQLAHVTDLVPTLLEVAGITPPATPADVIHVADKRMPKIVYKNRQYFPIAGKSILGWLKDDSNASIIHKEPVIDELNSQVYVKTDKWKALWRKDSVKWELFDFKASRVEPVAIPGSPDKLTKLEESKLKELVEAWEKYEVLNGVAVTYDYEWPTTANNLDKPRTRPTGGQPANEDDPND
jgi:arylsulfatase